MLERDIIEDMLLLLRGFFSTPIISSLGRLGLLKSMRVAPSFTVHDFPDVPNKKLLEDSFRYFLRLGLLERADSGHDAYRATELGSEIFRRANSFHVPHSYSDYLHRYHEMLQAPSGAVRCEVDRLENVIGSGATHQRYFPPALSFLKRKVDFEAMVDVGCGDGQFLSAFTKAIPGKEVVGIDISRISTETTSVNLRAQFPDRKIAVVCCDALDARRWGAEVRRVIGARTPALSMWFLLHEISGGKPGNLIAYFQELHDIFPSAPILIGELVCQGDEVLARNNLKSLMPEYLFFHDISGQGILLWDEYHEVLHNIPYKLVFERLFDEASNGKGESVPSTFIWGLMPI